ncbi:transposase, partial [Pseudonocardia xinjiangensis]|nr:transposase [Pseudonocardia xinjiangensis]
MERFHRTLVDGWAFRRLYASESLRRKALPSWIHEYNHHRPHTACGARPRITMLTSVGRAGRAGVPPPGHPPAR